MATEEDGQKVISGQLFEILSKIFRVLTNVRITVPSSLKRPSADEPYISCIVFSCAYKQASGFLYPLEKGFMYVHKPPMYIRFEEIDNLHFARSDASTKSFDLEIVHKNGTSTTFSSIAKEEYNKLFDFAQNKGLKIRNATRLDNKYKVDAFAGSDDEIDPYKESLRNRAAADDDDDGSDSEDEDFDVDKAVKKQQADKDSSEGSGSEPDEEYDSSGSDVVTEEDEEVEKKKPKKDKVEKKEKSEKKEKKESK